MDIHEFNRRFAAKMEKIKEFSNGDDIKDIVGVEAREHYKESFANQGFTDKVLNPWKDVKRRDKTSRWYGHEGQTGKFSDAATTRKILSGRDSELQGAITYRKTERGVRISNDKAYASVHNYGGRAKIYGKKEFQMPQRRFIGRSAVMIQNIKAKILREYMRILNDN